MRFDDAFANSKYLAGAKDFPPRWAAKAAGFREGMGQNARLGQVYGAGERNWFDLYLPATAAKGVIVFIHGGYCSLSGRAISRIWRRARSKQAGLVRPRPTRLPHRPASAP